MPLRTLQMSLLMVKAIKCIKRASGSTNNKISESVYQFYQLFFFFLVKWHNMETMSEDMVSTFQQDGNLVFGSPGQ